MPDVKPDGSLRRGWTTGACATAAAKAAYAALLGGTFPDPVPITLPGGATVRFALAETAIGGSTATAAVVKDAGDDPDVTHGALVRAEVQDRPVLNNWDRVLAYLTAALSRERVEQFRVLFLDNKNRLLADEAQSRGTVDHTPVYPREVVKRALELHATALILVHNHPSGDPTPSREDLGMTKQVQQAAAVLSIVLHDHVIVGNGRWLSFRQEGLL